MKVIVIFLLTLCFYQSIAIVQKEGCYTLVTEPDDGAEEFPLSRNCLHCLCQVTNGCQSGCRGAICGPFAITKQRWASAHKRENNDGTQKDYMECVENAYCAVRTVQRYMKKHLSEVQSCRPDRSLCENGVALHYLGSSSAHHDLSAEMHQALFTCLHKRGTKWLEIDDN